MQFKYFSWLVRSVHNFVVAYAKGVVVRVHRLVVYYIFWPCYFVKTSVNMLTVNAFVVGLPSAVTPISIPVPTQHVCLAVHWAAIPALWDTVDSNSAEVAASASPIHPPVFLPYSMHSHASEPCETRYVGGSDRMFDGNHKVVVDCGGSRVSISGKRLLEYKRAGDKKGWFIFFFFALLYPSLVCLTYNKHFDLPAFRNWEKILQLKSSPSFTILLLCINRHFRIFEHQ